MKRRPSRSGRALSARGPAREVEVVRRLTMKQQLRVPMPLTFNVVSIEEVP